MPKWKDRLDAMIRGELPPPPVGKLIGIRLMECTVGQARFELDADERHWNPMGTVHGGILVDLADGAMGVAFASTLDEDESFTTLELKINFLRPVWNARVTATARVVQRGSTIGLIESDLTDENGNLVAKASSTCMVLRGQAARER